MRKNQVCTSPIQSRQVFPSEYYNLSQNVLDLALKQVAAYKSWRAFDLDSESSVDARYAAMPAFTKNEIRKHFPYGLVANDRDIDQALASGEIEFVKTSGSTGDRVSNIWNQKWWDASERASWALNSYAAKNATGDHREAILVNPLNVGIISDDVELSFKKRRLSRFLYLNEKTNPSCWTPEFMDRMIKELDLFKPVFLEANPSYLAKLSRYIEAQNKRVFQPKLIVFTYEFPMKFHYQQIQRVFDVPIASSYGTTEVGSVFMECEAAKLHQNIEFCRVDFQPLKPEHGGPNVGRILVTTFNNPWSVMVRFDVGDLVRIDESGECPCGRRSGFILSAIEGRTRNVTLTCKGRLVTLFELDTALSLLEGVDEYQLDQVAIDRYRLHLVSQRIDKPQLSEEAKNLLMKLYGRDAKISVFFESAIPPSISGKYSASQVLFPLKIEDFLDERYFCKI